MTCPHCGAAVQTTEKFCPKCSRLVDSPLLRIKQELDAARAELIGRRVTSEVPSAPQPPQPAPPPPPRPTPPPSPRAPAPPPAPPAVPPTRSDRKKKARLNLGSPADHKPHGSLMPDSVEPPGQAKASETAVTGARPRLTKALGVMLLLDLVTLALLFAGRRFLEGMPEGTLGYSLAGPARVLNYVAGGVVGLAALGLWFVQPFGRSMQRLVALLWLPVVPFGTLLGLVMWVYLGRPGVKLVFSGGRRLSPAEHKQAAGSRKLAPVMAAVLFVLGLVAVSGVVGLVASAGTLLMERRSVREAIDTLGGVPAAPSADGMSTPLDELRLYAAAQEDYARYNGGLYDRTECLVEGASCIPGNPSREAPLPRRFLSVERGGYEFLLRLGSPIDPRPEGVSATSMLHFAYLARPTVGPATTGYCIDSLGTVCEFPGGEPLPVAEGRCSEACVQIGR